VEASQASLANVKSRRNSKNGRGGEAASQYPLVRVLGDYITLTKPRVQSLLLFTTVAAMYIAGDPSLKTVLLTCIGGYLSAGGAGAINHYLDRDIDSTMERTATRPVPTGRISPKAALVFGSVLAATAVVELSLLVNPLAAALSFSGFIGYVFIYTLWLKRRSVQNIVIGGAAGAIPPLVGWAAVQNSISISAILLFAIIFYWTPPHFWALSLLMKDDYRKAGIPMMPVVHGSSETAKQILIYSWLLLIVTLLPVVSGLLSTFYAVTAALLGFAMVTLSTTLREQQSRIKALRVYLYSLIYLALLFAAMVIDVRL